MLQDRFERLTAQNDARGRAVEWLEPFTGHTISSIRAEAKFVLDLKERIDGTPPGPMTPYGRFRLSPERGLERGKMCKRNQL